MKKTEQDKPCLPANGMDVHYLVIMTKQCAVNVIEW